MSSTSSPFDLRSRFAVIAGGNRGIGRSIALGMARAGAAVAVLARDEERSNQVPARWGEADEIAGAAVFLASAAADFITGTTLPVDGGYSVC